MDSVTQFVLGAMVGECLLGRRLGLRAALIGGALGTLPDLDVLATPFITPIQELAIHRGLSHSLAFTILATPLLGGLLRRLQPRCEVSWRDWSRLVFWALLTHILLDCFTTYGTQIFQPFSDYPVAFSSIFIIDPLYTGPLLLGLLVALWLGRQSPGRRRAIVTGLGLSTAYLLLTLGSRWQAETVFREALAEQGREYQQLWLMPTAFNSLLWIGMAADADGLWIGHYSLLDADRRIPFRRVEKNRQLLAGLQGDPVVQRLLWFSRGFYTVHPDHGGLRFDDLHLPRSDVWLTVEGDAIFSYRLLLDPAQPHRVQTAERVRPERFQDGIAGLLLARIRGRILPGTVEHSLSQDTLDTATDCRTAC